MKIDDYALLLKLNEVGTIRGTAKEVLISQPAVSQRLKYIENYLQETLFIRTQRRLVLTPSGELVLNHAEAILERERALKEELAYTNENVRGTLSIACSSLISQRFLPNILAVFTNRYPEVSIDLVTGISETITRDREKYHVSITRGDALKDATCIRIFEDPLYIFDTLPFPQGDLKKRPLISFKSGDSMNNLVDHWLHDQRESIQPIKTIQVDQIETCKQFMKEGLGMAVLPLSVSQNLLMDYPNMPLKLNQENVTRNTWICYQEEIRKLPQVDRFIQTVLETDFMEQFKEA